MRIVSWMLLCLLAAFSLHSGQACAQPLVDQADSIESTVLNAGLVLVAKLIKIGEGKQVDGRDVYNTVIEVEQNLKREIFNDTPYDKVQADITRDLSVLNDWKERSCRLLVLYYDFQPYETKVIELAPGEMEVWKADLTLLREPSAVIDAAKEALRTTSPAIRRIHTFGLHVPRERIEQTQWAKYHGLILNVPVNAQLERQAIDYLRSANYLERHQAVRALRYFRSKENIARVKELLNDPGWAYLRHPQQNNGIEVRRYGVREEAYQTLKYWGVEVAKPMIEEEIVHPPGVDDEE
ncbi:hypothetical protein [Bremerella sp.]|uniref:hypothetical protein n=1 Tax=Bremerella sp. TaxID=2795602 RepID=UPI00391A6073